MAPTDSPPVIGPGRLSLGKVPWSAIADAVRGNLPPEVLLGPKLGEDAALVRIGGEIWAVASDPITFSSHDCGHLSVVVNANDIAARGATPLFYTAVVLLAPSEATEARVTELLGQIRQTCATLGVTLIGGHTEVTPDLPRTIIAGTMLGPVRGRAITSSGLRPGDRVALSKAAGLEGTSILLADFAERLSAAYGPLTMRSAALSGPPSARLSILAEARIAAQNPHVTALHDVTEGGVGEALYELGHAAGLTLDVDHAAIPVLPETELVCRALGIDPLGLIGSGALLIGCADAGVEALTEAAAGSGVALSWIATARPAAPHDRSPLRFARDELLKAWLMQEVRTVALGLEAATNTSALIERIERSGRKTLTLANLTTDALLALPGRSTMLVVVDSPHNIQCALRAGCRWVTFLGAPAPTRGHRPDIAFPTPADFDRYLALVL